MSDCCKRGLLLGRRLRDELITSPEESYWLWCVVVGNLETSWMRRPLPPGGCCAKHKTYMVTRLWRSSLCIFLHSPISSSVSGPNISFTILFSHTTSLSCPYKTTSLAILKRNPANNFKVKKGINIFRGHAVVQLVEALH